MSHFDLKNDDVAGPDMSLIFPNVTCQFEGEVMSHAIISFNPLACRMLLSLMFHVESKKCPCRPVDVRGQGSLCKFIILFQFAFFKLLFNSFTCHNWFSN